MLCLLNHFEFGLEKQFLTKVLVPSAGARIGGTLAIAFDAASGLYVDLNDRVDPI